MESLCVVEKGSDKAALGGLISLENVSRHGRRVKAADLGV